MDFNSRVQKLKNNGIYFKQLNPIYVTQRRIIGVNNNSFRVDDSEVSTRENYICYSDKFEKILKDSVNDQKELLNNPNYIENLFYAHKNQLDDIGWLLFDYY